MLLATYAIFGLLIGTNFSFAKMFILPIVLNIPLTTYFYVSQKYNLSALPLAHGILITMSLFLCLIRGDAEGFVFVLVCSLPTSVMTFIISSVIKMKR
jgi:hypothetical protein